MANDGVKIIDCNFDDVGNGNNVVGKKHEAIRVERAWVDIDGGEFKDLPYGIVLEGTDPLSEILRPSSIVNADFEVDFTAVELLTYDPLIDPAAPNKTANLLENNKFSSGKTGVFVDQSSLIEIVSNDFSTSDYGAWILDSRYVDNKVDRNSFNGIAQACIFEGANTGLQFWSNCFSGLPVLGYPDINVTGKIPMQGNTLDESGNDFTKNGQMEIASSVDFEYHVEETRQSGELEFLDNSIGATQMDAQRKNSQECGAMFSPNPNPDECLDHFASIDEIISLLDQIDLYSESIISDDESQKVSRLKSNLYRQLIQKTSTPIQDGTGAQNYDSQVKARLLTESNFELRSFVPSISIGKGEYQLAKIELNGIVSSDAEESNYLEAQKIYIDFLMSGRTGVSDGQIQFLRDVGYQQGSLNAYARTILHIVAGERIEHTAPIVPVQLENRERKGIERTVVCYPNPVEESTIYVSVSENEYLNYNYTLMDTQGTNLSTGSLESNSTVAIDVSDLSSGVYILIIDDSMNNSIHNERIVLVD